MTMLSQYRQVLDVIGLIVVSLVFPVNVVLSTLDASGQLGLNNSLNSNQFNGTLTNPAPWTFAIWGVIFTWQSASIIYAWTFVCRPNAPKAIYTGVNYGFAIATLFSIVWIFVWGAPLLSAAAVLLISCGFSLYFTIGSEAVYLAKATDIKFCELWLTRILVQNGLALYTTWITIASLLNVNVALQYDRDVSPPIASYIVLFALAIIVLIYFVLESTVLDKYIRHVYTVYPVLIWALIGVLANNWNQNSPSGVNLLTLGLLIVIVTLAFVRIVLFILFTVIRPLNHKLPESAHVC